MSRQIIEAIEQRRRVNGREVITATSYRAMVQRMTDPDHVAYPRYGGAGLGIEPSFLGRGGYRVFLSVVGRRPSREYTLDRIDVTRGYFADNLRWATRQQQQANRCKKYEDMTVEEQSAYNDMCEVF